VIEARFFLINEGNGRYDVVFDKRYRETEAISSREPDALVKGWEAACRRMFGALVDDLQKVPVA